MNVLRKGEARVESGVERQEALELKCVRILIHEALFMGQPLGFAIDALGTTHDLTLEMEALICRLIVALMGAQMADYVHSPVNMRQRHGLNLG